MVACAQRACGQSTQGMQRMNKIGFDNDRYLDEQSEYIIKRAESFQNKLYLEFEGEPKVKFLSHTIDPDYDDVTTLNEYANHLGVKSSQWHFVTGNKEEIYDIAHNIYKNSVLEDKGSEDGFIHSGAFILVDKDGKIIKHYDGLNNEEIEKLSKDIKRMINEMK